MTTNGNEKRPLPPGWTWTTIGETTNPERDRVKPQDYPELPFIGMDDVEAETMRLIGTKSASEMKSSSEHFWPGDVLYGSLRPYLNKVYHPDFEGLCSAEFIVFRKAPHLSSKYLQYFLNQWSFVAFINKQNTGDRPRVKFAQMADYPFPLAPLPEQERIVAEIEKQFTRLDQAVASLRRLQGQLARYKASLLKAACNGRLVPQDPSDEPADQLLQRILAERRAQWQAANPGKKYKEPAGVGEVENLPNLPKIPANWVWVTLGQLSWSVKDGPHYSPKYADEGIPFISGGNVRPHGVDFENTKFITPELHEELSKRCKPELGDILYTKGGTTGIARVNTYEREFNVWVHVAVLKLIHSVEPFYIQHALNSLFCYLQSQKYTHGVGNQDLGLTRMIKIILALPPLAEQQRIVAEVERRLSVVAAAEGGVAATLIRAGRLRQTILQRAFSGRLV
jgi:type I restriction enzyme, S subunit